MFASVVLFVMFCIFVYLLDYPEGDNFKIARAPRRRGPHRVRSNTLRSRRRVRASPRRYNTSTSGGRMQAPSGISVTSCGLSAGGSSSGPGSPSTVSAPVGLPRSRSPGTLVTRCPQPPLASLPAQVLLRAPPASLLPTSRPLSPRLQMESGSRVRSCGGDTQATAAALANAVRCLEDSRSGTQRKGFSFDETSA